VGIVVVIRRETVSLQRSCVAVGYVRVSFFLLTVQRLPHKVAAFA
jgi:hypothetical protein